MKSEWQQVQVAEVCDLIVDCINKTAPTVNYPTPYKMIRTSNIRNGKIDLSNTKYVTKEIYEKWTRRTTVEPNDVLLTREAPLGEVGIIRRKDTLFLGQRIMQYRANTKMLDPYFLFYTFCSQELQNQFYAHSGSGSVVDHIRVGDCLKFLIPLPPLPEQKAIARILGTLDDKIELNQQMNRTLEATARAIFKSWFVDFDPVRALIDGRQPEGMDAQTAALFPDVFEDSELGMIPKGWKVRAIEELGEVICGKTPPTKNPENYGDFMPFITIPDMHGQVFATETKKYLSFKGVQSQTKKTLPPGSICVSCIATPGLVVITDEPSQTNQQVNSLVPSKQTSTFFAYFSLCEVANEIKMRGSGGSVFSNLNKGQFSILPVIIPSPSIQIKYQKLVEPFFKQLLINNKKSRTLANLRDTLLPKLMSGELRVVEAEKMVEEVV